ncbi:hypothetical protein PQX77_002740, partial [Marasmius sp. AFHP31]
MELERKDEQLMRVKEEMKETEIKHETLQNLWDDFQRKLPLMHTSTGPDAIIVHLTDPPLPPLDQSKYPKVYWTEESYEASIEEDDTDGLATSKRGPGRPTRKQQLEQDEHTATTYRYLQSEDGKPTGFARRERMTTVLYRRLHTLHQRGLASSSWCSSSDIVERYIFRGLATDFIEFRLAKDNWKLERFVKYKYPGWARGRFVVDNPRKRKKKGLNNERDGTVESLNTESLEPHASPEPSGNTTNIDGALQHSLAPADRAVHSMPPSPQTRAHEPGPPIDENGNSP